MIKILEDKACEYCATLFTPKRRWVQRYCNESCRSLACRERKNGMGGTLADKKRSVSVTDLYHKLQEDIQMLQSSQNNQYEYAKIMMEVLHSIFREVSLQKTEHIYALLKEMNRELPQEIAKSTNEIKQHLTKQDVTLSNIEKRQQEHLPILLVAMLFAPELGKKLINLIAPDNPSNIDSDKLKDITNSLKAITDKFGL
jgi:gas vesicle protein